MYYDFPYIFEKNKLMKKLLILISGILIFTRCSTNNNGTVTVIPLAPTNLTGLVNSTTQINLSWTDNATNEDGYKIERKSGNGNYTVVGSMGANLTTFNDLGLATNTTYTYRVYAYNSAGNSLQYSNEITLTTQDSIPSWLTNGLVGYWPFNGNANDESGNGNDGTVYGATLTSDRFGNVGKAYSFLNNYILVPSSNLFNSNDLSVSMWVNSSSSQSQVPLIRLTYSDASNEHFGFTFNFYHQSGVEFVAKYNNPTCAPGSGWERNEKIQNILDSNFHHIVGTIIGNTTNLYIDGILANTITTPYSQTSSCWNGDIQIGRNWSNFTDYFIGKIDDIRFYNRALSQSEVTYLATH